jgi:uncharacterized protein (TIGR03067 family)
MRLFALLAAGLFAGAVMAAPVPKAKDEDAILGTWKIEKVESGDPGFKGPPAMAISKLRVVFKKDGKAVEVGQDGSEHEAAYTLDPSGKPKAVDITRGDQTTLYAYDLDGDTLRLCVMSFTPKTRPAEVNPEGKGVTVRTLTRVRDEKKDEPKKDK